LFHLACEGNGDVKESLNVFGLGKTRCVGSDVVLSGGGEDEDGFSLSECPGALKDMVEKGLLQIRKQLVKYE
jgi:hypothetical protein